MKMTILTIFILLPSFAARGQCTVSLTAVNSIWCKCTGSILATPTGIPPFEYQWTTGDTTDYIDSLCPGTYIVTVTDSLNCIAVNYATITNAQTPLNISFIYIPPSCGVCCDAQINATLSGGCPPYNYNWTPDPPFCPGTTYTLIVTDNCGCITADSLTPDTVTVGLAEQLMQNNLICQAINKALRFSIPVTELKIFDMPGNLVFNYSGKGIIQIDEPELKTGLYIIKAKSETGRPLTAKIIILKQ